MSAYFNSTIARDNSCKNLVDVNPDVLGLGVVVTTLVHSILVVGITLCISLLHLICRQDIDLMPLRNALAKGLYKVCGVLYGTFFAQLIASLVIFDSLSFDQRFLIAATQVIATVQITTSGFFFKTYTLLRRAHTTLCLIQSALSFAFGIMAMRPDKDPLEKGCLVSYWPSGLSSLALRPDILAMLGACWWVIMLVYMCAKSWPAKAPKTATPGVRAPKVPKGKWNQVAPITLASSIACCWVVMVYFTVTTYVTAGHLKRSSADQELRSFGQILALCTIGGSLWQLIVCIVRRHKETPSKKTSAEPDIETELKTTEDQGKGMLVSQNAVDE